MKEPGNVEIISPAGALAAKVGRDGPDAEELLARADAEIEKLIEGYAERTAGTLGVLTEALASARSDTADRPGHVERIFALTHDIKGQAGTFGFELATEVADSQCRFIAQMDAAGDRELDLIGTHVGALNAIIRNGIRGDGGDTGREIIAALDAAIGRSSEPQ